MPGGLPAIAVSWLLGNLCVQVLPALPGPIVTVPLVLAAAAAFAFPVTRLVGWAIVGVLWTSFSADARLDDRLPEALAGRDFEVTGWVDAFPSVSETRAAFSFRVDRAGVEQVPERIRLTWYDPPADLEAGRDYALVVRLRPPRGLANPGAFDYERWLMLEGYGATGYVRSGDAVSRRQGLGQEWLIRRHEIAKRIAAASPSPGAAALITALAIGEREGFDDGHWEQLRRTGTSHLVAISGMHIGLVAALVFVLVRLAWLRMPRTLVSYDLEAAAAASGIAAFTYAALAGFGLPTQRAVLMVAVALAMLVSRRSVGLFHGLAAALLAILAWDPLAPLTASFWLSFGAVAALLALGSRREQVRPGGGAAAPIARRLRVFARVQWNITLALVPLLSLFFGEISLVSPLVNFVAIPFFSLIMVPLTLASTAALAFGEIGSVVLGLAGIVADGVWAALDWIALWPWAAVTLPEPAPYAAALAVLGVFMGLAWHPLPGRRLAWLGLSPLALSVPDRPAPGTADVLVFDVGHGLAVLVETAERRLLFDAGPVARSGFDAGREVVVPGLMRRDRDDLDMLIVSHADADHSGGAGAVLAAFPGADVLHGPDVDAFPGAPCLAGQHWVWNDVRFDILHPPASFARLGNESSCVLKVSTRAGSMLVTGDIESHAERLLVDEPGIRADIAIVPHHGSATSSSAPFVSAVGAGTAIVSAGHANRWGFPRPEVRQRWEAAGARVIVTGDSGAVGFRLGAGPVRVRAERAGTRRYWRATTPLLTAEE